MLLIEVSPTCQDLAFSVMFLTIRFSQNFAREVPTEARDRVLPAADLSSVLPDRHHILGVLLDQSGGSPGQGHPRFDHFNQFLHNSHLISSAFYIQGRCLITASSFSRSSL